MRTTYNLAKTFGLCMLLLTTTLPLVAADHEGDNNGNECNFTNEGTFINIGGTVNAGDCNYNDNRSSTTYTQYCDQGTGAGAGAAAVGVGPGSKGGDAGAGAGASTECTQNADATES